MSGKRRSAANRLIRRSVGRLKIDRFLASVGARRQTYDHVFQMFLPDRDRTGRRVGVKAWEDKALRLQAELFEGATSVAVRGAWRTEEPCGGITIENTRVILSFVKEGDWTLDALRRLTEFLRAFGSATRQETVAFTIDREMRYIDIHEE